jgi:hypothetical protein
MDEDELREEDTRYNAAFLARVGAYYKTIDDLGLEDGCGPPWPRYWLWLMMVDSAVDREGLLS